MADMLNSEQRAAYDAIVAGKSIFLTGPGGTGKSFLLHLLVELLPQQTGREVALTALTGCAALLLHSKAKTIHSWAGIGLGKDTVPILVSNIRKSRKSAARWKKTDVLVIDEVSMMTPELFEKLDEVARILRKCQEPFGGLQMVLVGDFYQLPPVQEGSDTSFVFESPLWKQMKLMTHELTKIVRQKDPEFQTVLNEARRGELTKQSIKILKGRIGLDYKNETIQPTMLFTRRAQVDDINMRHLKGLTTQRMTFNASTEFKASSLTADDPMVQTAVAKLDNNSSYTRELTLAIGAQVMLTTNLMPQLGLINGSRGVVVGYGPVEGSAKETIVPIVKFRNGREIPIDYATWDVDIPGVLRRQIPLRLAYAITIHKAQGATLDCALIDVGGRTFEFGQAYVALSRVKDLESLYIHDLEAGAFRAHPKVKKFYGV